MIYSNLNPFAVMFSNDGNDGSDWQIKCGLTAFKRSQFRVSFRFDYDIFRIIASLLILGKSDDGYREKEGKQAGETVEDDSGSVDH